MVRDTDGTIREISAEQAQEARLEYSAVLGVTSEIIGGLIHVGLRDFTELPFIFTQALNIHRRFINEQKKDE